MCVRESVTLYIGIYKTMSCAIQGVVQFDSVGSRKQSEIRLLQYRIDNTTDLQLALVAMTTDRRQTNFSYVVNENHSTLFPGTSYSMLLSVKTYTFF